jgi:hypothetical protein
MTVKATRFFQKAAKAAIDLGFASRAVNWADDVNRSNEIDIARAKIEDATRIIRDAIDIAFPVKGDQTS